MSSRDKRVKIEENIKKKKKVFLIDRFYLTLDEKESISKIKWGSGEARGC